MLKLIGTAMLFTLAVALGAVAQTQTIEVQHPWARATPPGAKSAAVYLTIVNHGSTDDHLVSVVTLAAGKAELHETTNANGVMGMRPAGVVPIKAGASLVLKPGGYHIMLTELKQPLVEGENVPITLTFEKAGTVSATATVEKAGSMGPGDMPGMKM
jgi:periplasmic copper chaperone A